MAVSEISLDLCKSKKNENNPESYWRPVPVGQMHHRYAIQLT